MKERPLYVQDEFSSTNRHSVGDIEQASNKCLSEITHDINKAGSQCKELVDELGQISKKMTSAETERMKKQVEKDLKKVRPL